MKPDRTRYLVPDEFRKLLAAARGQGQPSVRDRNYMMLALAGNLGLRVGEVTVLRVADFDFTQSTRPFVRVKTLKKRRTQENDLALDLKLASAVKSYVKCLRKQHKGVADSKLCMFPSRADPCVPITTRGAQIVFKQAAKNAGLDRRVSFHALRHYRGNHLWNETHDLVAVQKMMRHSSISSTGVYMHLGDEEEIAINKRVGSVL